jgi:hypothetical protein
MFSFLVFLIVFAVRRRVRVSIIEVMIFIVVFIIWLLGSFKLFDFKILISRLLSIERVRRYLRNASIMLRIRILLCVFCCLLVFSFVLV